MSIIGNIDDFSSGTARTRTQLEQDTDRAVDIAIGGINKGTDKLKTFQQRNAGFNPLDWYLPANADSVELPADYRDWAELDKWVTETVERGSNFDSSLVQIGDSPIWRSSNDPVDPWDCERWPNSPYCGGMNHPRGFIEAALGMRVGGTYSVSSTGCETCFTYQPNFLGIPGPITRVCYRKSDEFCSIPSNVPDEFEKNFSDAPKALSKPVAPSGFSRVLMGWTLQTDEWKQGESKVNGVVNGGSTVEDGLEWTQFLKNGLFSDFDIEMGYGLWAKVTVIPGVIMMGDSGFPMKPWAIPVNSSPPSGSFKASIRHPVTKIPINLPGLWALNWTQSVIQVSNESFTTSSGTHFEQTWILQRTEYSIAHWIDFGCFDFPASKDYQAHIDDFFNIDGLDLFYRIFLSTYVLPSIPYNPNQIKIDALGDLTKKVIGVNVSSACFIGKIKPPIPKPEPDPMDCCDEVLEKLELLELRTGCNEFPVKAPNNLAIENSPVETMENHTQLWAWLARNIDGLNGQFPIKLVIDDTDPTKEGEQSTEIELPNIAEAMGEIFGLAYQSEIKIDLLSEIILRLVPEIIATKNASLVSQSYSKANASYLGYKANLKPTEVPCNFNLEDVESIPDLLKDSKVKLLTYRDESKETLQDTLERLMYAASIIKSAFVVRGEDKDRLVETISSMFQDEIDNVESGNKTDWADWLGKINRNTSFENKGQRIQPKIEIVDNSGVNDGTI